MRWFYNFTIIVGILEFTKSKSSYGIKSSCLP